MPQSKKTALVLVFDGVEEIEALAPVDILRRCEVRVTIAGVEGDRAVKGRNDISFLPDVALDDIDPSSFDLFVLPGGPGVMSLVNDKRIHKIIQERDKSDRLISAICAAPKVLAQAGVLQNRQATSHASVRDSLTHFLDRSVVVDGHITTSQGAGTAVAFGLALAAQLTSKAIADDVASSIHSDLRQ